LLQNGFVFCAGSLEDVELGEHLRAVDAQVEDARPDAGKIRLRKVQPQRVARARRKSGDRTPCISPAPTNWIARASGARPCRPSARVSFQGIALRCTLDGSPAIEDVCLLCVGRLAGCSGRAGCCVLGCRLAAPGRHSMSPQAMRSPLLAGPLTPARGVSIIVCLAWEQTNTGSWVARAAAAAHYPSGYQIQRSKLLPPRRATSTRARYKVLPDL
jgi:hypothetical protein